MEKPDVPSGRLVVALKFCRSQRESRPEQTVSQVDNVFDWDSVNLCPLHAVSFQQLIHGLLRNY